MYLIYLALIERIYRKPVKLNIKSKMEFEDVGISWNGKGTNRHSSRRNN